MKLPLKISQKSFSLLVSTFMFSPLHAATYQITSVIPGFFATGFNDSGQVSGYTSPGTASAAVWNGTALVSVPGIQTGGPGQALSINSNGVVVGYSQSSSSTATRVGFVYSGGTSTALPNQSGYYNTPAKINDSGVIVGTFTSNTSTNTSQAYLYNGITTTILAGIGGALTTAVDVNGSGWVTGSGTEEGGAAAERRAWLYNGTTTIDLGTLGGDQSIAYALNDLGHVVGGSTITGTAAIQQRAFLYRDGQMINLQSGTAWENTTGGYATDINNLDQVVGRLGATAAALPFLWENGEMFNLLDLVDDELTGNWFTPVAINDNGDILMTYLPTGSSGRATVILSQVPEPSVVLLGAAGIIAGLCSRRRPCTVMKPS